MLIKDVALMFKAVLRVRIRIREGPSFFAESEIFVPDSDSDPDSDPVPDPVI
jgi:hypothetical protein